jgi:hypothetical protein
MNWREGPKPHPLVHDMCKEEHYEMKCKLRGNSRLASRLDMGLERKRGLFAYISRVNDEIVEQIPLGEEGERKTREKMKVRNKAKRPLY